MKRVVLGPIDGLTPRWFACARCPWSEPVSCRDTLTHVRCHRCGAAAYPRALVR